MPTRCRWRIYSGPFGLDPTVELACHFHNTYGLGLANCMAALRSGVTYFRVRFWRIGRLPVHQSCRLEMSARRTWSIRCSAWDLRTDIKLDALLDVARQVAAFFGRELPGLVLRSGSIVDFQGQPTTGGHA